MNRYLAACLGLALALCFWLNRKLDGAITEISVKAETIRRQSGQLEALENSLALTDRLTAGWDADRTNFSNLRGMFRKEIREAMKDESFKAWASSRVHPDAERMLREAVEKSGLPSAACGPDADGSGVCPVR